MTHWMSHQTTSKIIHHMIDQKTNELIGPRLVEHLKDNHQGYLLHGFRDLDNPIIMKYI